VPKGQRIIIFLVTLLLLAAVYLAYKIPFDAIEEKGIVIISALIMLSFVTLFAEHYFTRPTDVIASSISILLLISPLHSALDLMGTWYWIFWWYCAIVLISALASLLLLDKNKLPDNAQNRSSEILKTLAIRFGSGKFLWFTLFVLCLLFYVDSQSNLFLILFGYSAILVLIDPKKAINGIIKISKKPSSGIGELFGIHSSSAYLARLYPDSASVKRFDVVGFVSNATGDNEWKSGLILETYELNDQRWLKIITDDSFTELEEKTSLIENTKPGVVHTLEKKDDIDLISRFVGTVCEGADIEKLKFEYAFNVPIQEGELLEVKCDASVVLYQVVEGITGTEPLESRNEAGVIVGEAVQLGVWNPESRSFDRYGWVPKMNSPVLKSKEIDLPDTLPDEYQIGSIPGTNFPVFIDRKTAVTHHLAILGVTGSGKSVFARNLIRQIADEQTKVICVDFTNEYGTKLNDILGGSLVSGGDAATLFAAVDRLGSELDKFPNQRLKPVIDAQEEILRNGFKAAIESFVGDETRASLFELPDVTNSTGILEYTKWFFKSLFELAKANQLEGKRVCVVLEEAHTIVPEWNFIGIDDKRPGAVVNSISQIALQGRKYGVGFIVIAQRTANVSKTVLTQCNSVVAFQQFDRTSAEFMGNYMGSDFISSLTRLRPRHAIAVGKAFSSGTPMIFQVPEIHEPE